MYMYLDSRGNTWWLVTNFSLAGPQFGHICHTSQPDVALRTFSLSDLHDNNIVYVHEGAEQTGHDSLDYVMLQATDGMRMLNVLLKVIIHEKVWGGCCQFWLFLSTSSARDLWARFAWSIAILDQIYIHSEKAIITGSSEWYMYELTSLYWGC